MNTSREKIYQECANTKFQKAEIRSPFLVRETSKIDKKNYCRFHKGHKHTTNECIQLKDSIESLVKKGRLSEYKKGGKQYREESLKHNVQVRGYCH